MKKIILSIILFLISFKLVFAHPLDISVSTANIKWNNMNLTTYFHSFEIEYLLKNNWIIPDWVIDYFENEQIIKDYIKQNIFLYNNWKICSLWEIKIDRDEAYDVITNWLAANYSFSCDEKIKLINLQIKYFSEFKLQTNRITIYNLNNWLKDLKPLIYKVLTQKIHQLNIDIENVDVKRIDSDSDWLSDEEEKLYATDIKNMDSDGDFYTDKEEVDYWWNPLNKELWPWQPYRDILDLELSKQKIDELQKINNEILEKNLSDYWYNSSFLNKVMKYINDYFEKNTWNIIVIFFIVYVLWILHAAWPGHSKWLLIAYTLEKNNWYKKWLLFAVIFSITHIIDILILFMITKVIIHFVNPWQYLYYVQLISAIILFILSIYLIIKSFKNKNENCKNPSLFIAFLAWLAPCSFAWSIFLLLIALWKTSFLLPLIFALWLWIFTTLVIIVLVSVYLKNKAYSKIDILWRYSPVFSSFIILIISIILLYKIL